MIRDDIASVEAWTHNPEDGHPACALCGDEYVLHEDCEPTALCDVCVHPMVDRLIAEVRSLRVRLDEAHRELRIRRAGPPYQQEDHTCDEPSLHDLRDHEAP